GSVDANRNDGGKASYTYLDVAPLSGVSFYRIRSEEFNGKVLYSVIVKVDTRGGATDVVLYPNPTSGNVISMQATALNKGMYTIQVFNTSGQRVLTQSLNHPGGFVTQTIQLPALQSGMYSLQLSGGATRISKSFIVR
ncbi:MAG TPA: T9SS type A sorting domain-containing protein, partial [Chitinophagaceae bacterium]|nr:T9SS type A sorting domain-containing protein [Chitinophagaceae bacterium]